MSQTLSRSKVKNRFLFLGIKSLSKRLAGIVASLRRFAISHPNLTGLAKVSFVFVLFFIACYNRLDPDFGWHLQAGNYFRAHGIPSHDVFTYTARSFPWIDHAWGNDVLFSYLYQLHGYVVLALLFAGLWTMGLMINAWRARFVFLILAVAAMLPYVIIRPTAWDVFGLAIVLKLLWHKNLGKNILWLPLVILIWSNLHGGFMLGMALILYFAVMRKSWRLLGVFLLCIPVTFINPYGPRLYVEIFRTLTDWSLHTETKGMAPFDLLYSAWLLIALWGAGFWLVARKKLKSLIGLSPLFLIAGTIATRYFPFFIVTATPELNNSYNYVLSLLPKQMSRLAKNILRGGATVLVGAFVVLLGLSVPLTSNRETNYPVEAVAYLKTHQCDGNLFNDFDYGGYLIWQLPKVPVFIDGRMPSWRNPKGVKYFDIYDEVFENATNLKSTFKQYHVTCALVGDDTDHHAFISLLESEGWKTPVVANNSILLVAPN